MSTHSLRLLSSILLLLTVFLGVIRAEIAEATEATVAADALAADKSKIPHHRSDKACTRQLEGILYIPEVCVYEYMSGIAKQVKAGIYPIAEQLSMSNFGYLRSIMVNYNVTMTLSTSFESILITPSSVVSVPVAFSSSIAHTYLNIDGFVADVENQQYVYNFLAFASDGSLFIFGIMLPFVNRPLCCS